MKIFGFVLVAAMLVGSAAQAQYCRYHYCDDRGYHRHHDGDIAVGVACAPEVLQGNVQATDRTLATLAAQPEFAKATQFQAAVKEIGAVKAADQRAADYFALIGVESSNKDQVVEFIGARDVNSKYVTELQRQTGLSDAQATKVATEIQTALRGDLH